MEKATPFLEVNVNKVLNKYIKMRGALEGIELYYAIKACPLPEVVSMLASIGSGFDLASVGELELALANGARMNKCSFGNTIKKAEDIRLFYKAGVYMYATDSESDLRRIAEYAPNTKVYVRVLVEPKGAQWPLSKKFGTTPEEATRLLLLAEELNLIPYGVSFHPGSQQMDLGAWEEAALIAKRVFENCVDKGITLEMLNIGGGFPAKYVEEHPGINAYGKAISSSLSYFLDRSVRIIAEPGRGLVGDAGDLYSEVVLVDNKGGDQRWVFIDAGRYRGLAETEGESIKYKMSWFHSNGKQYHVSPEWVPSIIAGPSCDSADVLYEKNLVLTPKNLKQGDYVVLHSTGAYTSSYSAVSFNGFTPLETFAKA